MSDEDRCPYGCVWCKTAEAWADPDDDATQSDTTFRDKAMDAVADSLGPGQVLVRPVVVYPCPKCGLSLFSHDPEKMPHADGIVFNHVCEEETT